MTLSYAEISLSDFFSQWRREDFLCENPVLSEKSAFFREYWGKGFSLFQIKKGADILGFSFAFKEKKWGIWQLHSVRTPSLKKTLCEDDFLFLSQEHGAALSLNNSFIPFHVPDYLDPRIPQLTAEYAGADWGTLCMDFQEGKDLISSLSSKYLRRDIRRSLKDESLSCVPLDARDEKRLDDFCRLMVQEKNSPFPRSMWHEIVLAGEKHDAYKIFVVYQNNLPLAGCCLAYGNEVAFEEGLVVAESAKEQSPYAGIFLKYNMMQWALEKGIKTYDLMGFNPNPRNPKEKAIASFKKKFSNREIIYPVYSSARGLGRVAQFLKKGKDVVSKKA